MDSVINQVLIESSKKLLKSRNIDELKNELLYKAPPILWFGNLESNKSKILTVGANPSRQEFLSVNKKDAQLAIADDKSPEYLDGEFQRFYHLNELDELKNIEENELLRNKLIQSYNDYFKTIDTVYKWFGKKTSKDELSYNVEGFLNAINASYYESDYKYSAIHVDLLPFATISDFTSIKPILDKHYFKNNWAQTILSSLIEYIKPNKIILFGKTNRKYFIKNFGLKVTQKDKFVYEKENGEQCSSTVYYTSFKDIPVIGLSVNLGNPKMFNKSSLVELGKFVS